MSAGAYTYLPYVPEPQHDAVAAWFLGPKGENFDFFVNYMRKVLTNHYSARNKIYKHDAQFITPKMQASDLFTKNMKNLETELYSICKLLSEHSVPFWSVRYNGHMNMDITLPSTLGYFTAMLWNQNNVALEASPLTTIIETAVGQDMCRMLGYRSKLSPLSESGPTGWGHITCDGTVANLESTWAARNLKYYPLSLKLAIDSEEGKLKFLKMAKPPFEITLANGKRKAFVDCTVWELLNLKPSTILDIPAQLFESYGISQSFLQSALDGYLVQTLSKDAFEKIFQIKPGKMYAAVTRHYSWPKAAALTGIGRDCCIDIAVDYAARMDVKNLTKRLDECLQTETPVYMVVAIMGSTEQGAVDPLSDILKIREEYEAKGLSFVVHCDAAWGGYFATMLHGRPSTSSLSDPSYVPRLSLQQYTEEQLDAYSGADSITIDPHKSGYCPYPAGGLCYRDERMRYQVTWTSPIVLHDGDRENIGVYGVEGSKPGAAPVGVYLSHRVLGLNYDGYGLLLGEATFSSTRLYCHWATMGTDKSDVFVMPFNLLPAEKENIDHPDPEKVAQQKIFIREKILDKENSELVKDQEAMDLLQQLGSDLMINAFVCNFRIDGVTNTDVAEANYLNARIFNRLSVSSFKDDVNTRPLILTSTRFSQKGYGECLNIFKRRLGLKGDQDLVVLVNVTESPFPTANNFLRVIADEFEKVAKEEVKACIVRNKVTPDKHGFVMQGTDKLYLTHLPMFNMANHRYQVILTGDLPADIMSKYIAARKQHPEEVFILGSATKSTLPELIKEGGSFKAVMFMGLSESEESLLAKDFELTNIKIVVNRSLSSNALSPSYPDNMLFYLYGTGLQLHVDHILTTSPSQQLTSDQVILDSLHFTADGSHKFTSQVEHGMVAVFEDVRENSMQPIHRKLGNLGKKEYLAQGFTFAPQTTFRVSIYPDIESASDPKRVKIATGYLTLGTFVYTDDSELNMDPFDHVKICGEVKDHWHHAVVPVNKPIVLPGAGIEQESVRQHRIAEDWRKEWQKQKEVAAVGVPSNW